MRLFLIFFFFFFKNRFLIEFPEVLSQSISVLQLNNSSTYLQNHYMIKCNIKIAEDAILG